MDYSSDLSNKLIIKRLCSTTIVWLINTVKMFELETTHLAETKKKFKTDYFIFKKFFSYVPQKY